MARRALDGGPRVILAVECKDHRRPIGNQIIQEFVATAKALRETRTITASVLVSASGFTADARTVAWNLPDVTLLAWDDLTAQIFNVAHQLHAHAEEYERSPIFNRYLTLQVEMLSWASLTPVHREQVTVDDVITDWMAPTPPHTSGGALFVLGDFGSGKTTLLRHLEYLTAKRHLAGRDQRVPRFVALRSFRAAQDVTTLLRSSFRDRYYRDIPGDLLWQQVQLESLCVLLDGFDEMVERATPHDVWSCSMTSWQYCSPLPSRC